MVWFAGDYWIMCYGFVLLFVGLVWAMISVLGAGVRFAVSWVFCFFVGLV